MTYFDYMNEISADELLKGMLAHGLFADKIPDFLSSESFYGYCQTNGFCMFSATWHDFVRYETIRNINIPRLLAIPNPFGYANLCKVLSDNWDNIKVHFKKHTACMPYRRSQIHIRKTTSGNDALFQMNINYKDKDKEAQTIEDKLIISNKVVVYADISTCFPSIYSHSIIWALVGKDVAKAHTGSSKEWYNQIDRFSRNIKNGETNGLLIGPHTSNILSEIILTIIDKELLNFNFVRYIDDYHCFVKDECEADHFILTLSNELRKYDLSLNAKKTKIVRLPASSDTPWVHSLQEFFVGGETVYGKPLFRKQRLNTYLNHATELFTLHKDSAIYNYAIKNISHYYLGKNAQELYIDRIHHLLMNFPYLVHIVDNNVFDVFNVDNIRIQEISNDLYKVCIQKHLYEGCCFAIYWSLKYDFDLTLSSDAIIGSDDAILMLLAFLYWKKRHEKIEIQKFENKAEEILSLNDMDRYWIFVYEVASKDKQKEEFKSIKNRGVSFIKKEYQF